MTRSIQFVIVLMLFFCLNCIPKHGIVITRMSVNIPEDALVSGERVKGVSCARLIMYPSFMEALSNALLNAPEGTEALINVEFMETENFKFPGPRCFEVTGIPVRLKRQ